MPRVSEVFNNRILYYWYQYQWQQKNLTVPFPSWAKNYHYYELSNQFEYQFLDMRFDMASNFYSKFKYIYVFILSWL